MWGGPFSLCTSKVTDIFLLSAISCTIEIGDLMSELTRLSSLSDPLSDPHEMLLLTELSDSRVSGFNTSKALREEKQKVSNSSGSALVGAYLAAAS